MTRGVLISILLSASFSNQTGKIVPLLQFSDVIQVTANWDSDHLILLRQEQGSVDRRVDVLLENTVTSSVVLQEDDRLIGVAPSGGALIKKIESEREISYQGKVQLFPGAQYRPILTSGIVLQRFTKMTAFWEYGYDATAVHTIPFRASILSRYRKKVMTVESIRPPTLRFREPRISDQLLWIVDLGLRSGNRKVVPLNIHQDSNSFQCITWGALSDDTLLALGGWLSHDEQLIGGFKNELCIVIFDSTSGEMKQILPYKHANEYDDVELVIFNSGKRAAIKIGKNLEIMDTMRFSESRDTREI
ncbi:hypothetical protein C0431_11045 [bacterium]|nr:hypothetical protein [bacterium]